MIRFVCDSCGITRNASIGIMGESSRPRDFTILKVDNHEKHACSKECTDRIKQELDQKQEFIVEQ